MTSAVELLLFLNKLKDQKPELVAIIKAILLVLLKNYMRNMKVKEKVLS